MTALELFRLWRRERALQRWPENAPPEMKGMSPESAERILNAAHWALHLPRAELTSDLAEQSDRIAESEMESFRAMITLGNELTALRAEFADDARFWRECSWISLGMGSAGLEFAMTLAAMENENTSQQGK